MIELLLEAERALDVGMIDRAERLYRQAIAADPRNSIAVVGLARVALERGDEASALWHARRALAIDPENPAARRLVDRLIEVITHRGDAVPDGAPPASPPAGAAAPPVAPAPGLAPAPSPAPPTAPGPSPAPGPAPAPSPAGAAAPKSALSPEPGTAAKPPPSSAPPPAPAKPRGLLRRLIGRG